MFKNKRLLASVIWISFVLSIFGGALIYPEIKQSSLNVRRGDTVHFEWTADNKFYSSNCTNYGTAIDQVGNKAYKVIVFCAPVRESHSFVSLIIHWYDIVKVDQEMVLTKPSDAESAE